VESLPIVSPDNRKVIALQQDCKLLAYLFCNVGTPASARNADTRKLHELVVAEALLFLEKKREFLLWKGAPKEVKFEEAHKDYVAWKKEQKPKSIAVASKNCVLDYKGDGMNQQSAEEAVCILKWFL
jgi:hypothetical protein